MVKTNLIEQWRQDRSGFRKTHRILEDGRKYGEVFTEVQEEHIFRPLVERRKKYNFIKLSRGWDKTSGIAWYCLEELILGDKGQEIIIFAADAEQAGIMLQTIHDYLDRNPLIAINVKQNKNEIKSKNGRIIVMASDSTSSFGTKATLYVIDELHAWSHQNHSDLFYSVYTAIIKRKDARLIVLTNAGAAYSKVYFDVIDKVKESDVWYFFETKQSPPWISESEIEEQRKFLPPLVFARLHGNIDTKGAGNFITAEDLVRCVDSNLMPISSGYSGRFYCVGFDFGRVKDRAAVAICHREGNNVILDDCRWWKGTHEKPVSFQEVEEHLTNVACRFEIGKALFDPHQTQHLMERLRGIMPVEEFNFSQKSWTELATPFYHLLHYGRLKLYHDEMIETELLMLELKQTPAGIKFDHTRGGYSDISTAIALAALGCLKIGDDDGELPVSFDNEISKLYDAEFSGKKNRYELGQDRIIRPRQQEAEENEADDSIGVINRETIDDDDFTTNCSFEED